MLKKSTGLHVLGHDSATRHCLRPFPIGIKISERSVGGSGASTGTFDGCFAGCESALVRSANLGFDAETDFARCEVDVAGRAGLAV
jgi:hypothetical protein